MPMFGGLEEAFAPATMIAGAALAVVAIVVAAVALRSMFAAGDAMDSTVRLFGRKPRPVDHWLCGRCRSYNRVDQSRCYRGCGPREEIEDEASRIVHAGAETSAAGLADEDPEGRHAGEAPRAQLPGPTPGSNRPGPAPRSDLPGQASAADLPGPARAADETPAATPPPR